jgi:arylsulfatase
LDYLTGKVKESPRTGFIYVDDSGAIAALRYQDWKAMFLENRADQLQIWLEPFVELRAPYLTNLRRDPFEKALYGSNTYYDWYIDRAYILMAIQGYALNFLKTFQEYPPSQTAGDWSLGKVQKQIEEMASGTNK